MLPRTRLGVVPRITGIVELLECMVVWGRALDAQGPLSGATHTERGMPPRQPSTLPPRRMLLDQAARILAALEDSVREEAEIVGKPGEPGVYAKEEETADAPKEEKEELVHEPGIYAKEDTTVDASEVDDTGEMATSDPYEEVLIPSKRPMPPPTPPTKLQRIMWRYETQEERDKINLRDLSPLSRRRAKMG